MGKLSSIDEVEARKARVAPEPVSDPAPQERPQPARQRQPQAQSRPQPGRQAARLETAADEEDFHGISANESLGTGHTALVVIAAIALVAVVAYFANYWFHFV